MKWVPVGQEFFVWLITIFEACVIACLGGPLTSTNSVLNVHSSVWCYLADLSKLLDMSTHYLILFIIPARPRW